MLNIFYNTSIPTTIIILKKNRTNKDVFFIDASKEFEKGKNQNNMTDEHIAKILETYQKREDVEKFAHLASFEEIVENDYNLNIPRYVDTFEEEPVVPLTDLADQLAEIDREIEEVEARLAQMRSQLVGTTPEAQAELTAYLEKLNKMWEGEPNWFSFFAYILVFEQQKILISNFFTKHSEKAFTTA